MEALLPDEIPGQIEKSERKLLFDLASSIALGPDDTIVEFGTLFGRSTACLINGVLAQKLPKRGSPYIHAFDGFSYPQSHDLHRYVKARAEERNLGHLLRKTPETVNFKLFYDHFVGAAEAEGILKTTESNIANAKNDLKSIALMHIDAPKDYDDFRPLLLNFFPSLRRGAVVIFQDYFFQWSAGLIGGVQVLIDAGFIAPRCSAATSMVADVCGTFDTANVQQLDMTYQQTPLQNLIERAIATSRSFAVTDREIYAPRLALAKMQYLWSQRDYRSAAQGFTQLISEGQLSVRVLEDFLALLAVNFDAKNVIFQ